MLELYVFGPHFGLPDGSPFCIKALTLLKIPGLAFATQKMKRARYFPEAP